MKNNEQKQRDDGLAVTQELVEKNKTKLPNKIITEITKEEKPKKTKPRSIRKWTEYSHNLSQRGLRPNQIEAIKVFICKPVKTIVECSDRAVIVRSTLNGLTNKLIRCILIHDDLFN